MPADSKVEHHLPPTASCLMDDGPSAVEQGTGLKGTYPQKLPPSLPAFGGANDVKGDEEHQVLHRVRGGFQHKPGECV